MSGFANLCGHNHTKRIDKDFIKCTNCGESFIQTLGFDHDQKMNAYIEENRVFDDQFNRNFDNTFIPKQRWEKQYGSVIRDRPSESMEYLGGYVTYSGKDGRTEILVETESRAQNDPRAPPQHKVRLNGQWTTMSTSELKKYLSRVGAVRC
jgi:hypothetical protein